MEINYTYEYYVRNCHWCGYGFTHPEYAEHEHVKEIREYVQQQRDHQARQWAFEQVAKRVSDIGHFVVPGGGRMPQFIAGSYGGALSVPND